MNMNDKLYNDIKIKMIMKIHGLSRQEAKEKIKNAASAGNAFNISRHDDDELISAEEFFGV